MIRKYRIGTPFNTEAVTADIPEEKGLPEGGRDHVLFADGGRTLLYGLSEGEIIYGLGETVRGINKRGWDYISWNSDMPNHLETRRSLYASQNFLLFDKAYGGEDRCFGLYIDAPGKLEFDLGYTDYSQVRIDLKENDADIYILEGETPGEIVTAFRTIIGRSYVPPKWAFGLGQSRWSYMNEDEVREVADRCHRAGIPLDSIYLDIDYMERYKDFTLNGETFPDFAKFVSEMKEKGVHLVPIIDAGVKIEEGYDVYEEGVRNGYFVKDENGDPFVVAVWPGRSHFPDVLNSDARRWFGDKYSFLLDQGIDGFWNDMNEPSIFYTEKHLNEVFGELDEFRGVNIDIGRLNRLLSLVGEMAQREEDYREFYHDADGVRVRHDKVHNLFGYNMTRAAGEAFRRNRPGERILMFSRSSYVGMHRYGGVWTGDNSSRWEHLLLSLQQMPALNMCGFLYSGADVGGFGEDVTPDLMLRWLALAIFIPLFRNHSALGTRRQELYAFGPETEKKAAEIVRLRYALLPYLYSEFMKAVRDSRMLFTPPGFVWRDDMRARETEDELLVGESILIAPVVKPNASGRMVYLPEEMKLVRFRSAEDYEEEILPAGDHYIRAKLGEVVIFIRKGHVLPLANPAENTMGVDYGSLTYLCHGAAPEDYELYNDDGISPAEF